MVLPVHYISKKKGMKLLDVNAGCYQIVFELQENLSATIGSVGHFVMPQGFYVYTAKANRNLNSTIQRHLDTKKKIHCHMDYLTVNKAFKCYAVYTYPELFDPCTLHKAVLNEVHGHELIPGFGISSDDHCFSHLFYSTRNPDNLIRKIRFSFKQYRWNQ